MANKKIEIVEKKVEPKKVQSNKVEYVKLSHALNMCDNARQLKAMLEKVDPTEIKSKQAEIDEWLSVNK